jgi:hypothetical protein
LLSLKNLLYKPSNGWDDKTVGFLDLGMVMRIVFFRDKNLGGRVMIELPSLYTGGAGAEKPCWAKR